LFYRQPINPLEIVITYLFWRNGDRKRRTNGFAWFLPYYRKALVLSMSYHMIE